MSSILFIKKYYKFTVLVENIVTKILIFFYYLFLSPFLIEIHIFIEAFSTKMKLNSYQENKVFHFFNHPTTITSLMIE